MVNKYWKKLITLIGISAALAGGLFLIGYTPETTHALPLNFNGKEIQFTYTDDNTNENLIIETDNAGYATFDSLAKPAEMYFAITNISPDDQNVDIQLMDAGNAQMTKIEEFKSKIPYQIEVTDYGRKEYQCQINWKVIENASPGFADTKNLYVCEKEPPRFCNSVLDKICTVDKEIIGTHQETKYKDEWGNIVKKPIEDFKNQDQKPPGNNFVGKDQFQYWIPKGQTKYFHAFLTFPKSLKNNQEFYIKAFGSLGAYGSLDPYYNSSWTNRILITIDHTKVGTTTPISGFPIDVATTTANLKTVANGGLVGKTDGTDILFTKSDGTTKLNHELEFYASTTGQLIAWVNFPDTLSTTTNDTIYVYFGNPVASDQQNPTGVWDSNFKSVYHLPNGTTLGVNDSTSNANNGTNTNSTATTGKIDGGISFNGSNTNVSIGSIAGAAGTYTFSFWSKPGGSSGYNFDSASGRLVIDNGDNAPTGGAISYYDGSWHSIGSSYGTGTFRYIVLTFNAGSSTATGYLDGASVGTGAYSSVTTLDAQNSIGSNFSGSAVFWAGDTDEFRISTSVRNSSWILTEYNNQNSPGTFLSWGPLENAPSNTFGAIKGTTITGKVQIQGKVKAE